MGNLIIEIPDGVNWLNQKTDDFEAVEAIKIDGKCVSVPRIVAMLLEKMNDNNRGLAKQLEILNTALSKIK